MKLYSFVMVSYGTYPSGYYSSYSITYDWAYSYGPPATYIGIKNIKSIVY